MRGWPLVPLDDDAHSTVFAPATDARWPAWFIGIAEWSTFVLVILLLTGTLRFGG